MGIGWRALVILGLVWSTGSEAGAQAYRNAVGVPPVEVYRSMLNFAERKEYTKIMGSLNVISPIVEHITKKFKDSPAEMIKRAISSGNPDDVLLSVQTLVILDIKDLLDEALSNADQSPDLMNSQVKAARLDYEVLSPYVQKKDFQLDQKIKKRLTDSFQLVQAGSVYSRDKNEIDLNQVRRIWVEIVYDLSRVFPSRVF